jgi:hypothetical protein
MSTYRVKLTPEVAQNIPTDKYHQRNSLRVKIEASDVEGLADANIFGHKKTKVNDGTDQDEFCFVCSVADLSAYPVGTPAAGQDPAFFRKAIIDIYLPNPNLYDKFITEVTDQVTLLLTSLEDRDTLEASETYEQ